MINVISDLILNLGSLLICISVFLFLFPSHLLFFNLISLEYSGQWNEILPTKREKKKSHFSFHCLFDHAVTGLVIADVRKF